VGQAQERRRPAHLPLHHPEERQIRRLVRRPHHGRPELRGDDRRAGGAGARTQRGQVVPVPRHCRQQGGRVRSLTRDQAPPLQTQKS